MVVRTRAAEADMNGMRCYYRGAPTDNSVASRSAYGRKRSKLRSEKGFARVFILEMQRDKASREYISYSLIRTGNLKKVVTVQGQRY